MSTPEPTGPPSQPPPPVAQPQPAAQVAPGWYHDGAAMRWWDGVQWGPAAPQQAVSNNSGLATFAHLGFVVGGFILPLVIYISANDGEQPEVRYHAREALNHQLTVLLASITSVLLAVMGIVVAGAIGGSGDAGSGAGIGLAFVLFFGLFALVFAIVIGSLVLSIIAAVKANKGERYRYPLCIRFVRS